MEVPAGMADEVGEIVEHVEQVAAERAKADRRARIVAEASANTLKADEWYPLGDRYGLWSGTDWVAFEAL
jgi:hypothetical protein